MPSLEVAVDDGDFEREFLRLRDTLTALTLMHYADVRDAFAVIAKAAAAALQVGRVSLWRYNRSFSAITCVATWQDGEADHDPMTISRESHPVYWRRLHEDRTLPIDDAVHHPALAEFQADYVPRHRIGALLDSSVRADGRTFGIVCAEHLGTPRTWSRLERLFVASLADRVGLAILMDEQRQAERLMLHAQKMEALGLMAAGLAHDFNNVLSVVLSSSEMALHAIEHGQDVTEELQAIHDTARQTTAMTRRLLAVARREPMRCERVELNAVLHETQTLAQRLLPANVKLTAALTSAPLVISVDRGFLDQAMINLLTNAAQSMPDGGQVFLETAPHHSEGELQFGVYVPAGNYVRLSVRDEGGGIDASELSRVFDPFFSTKGQRGTGLGLAVVYNGMQQHDGLVAVQSATGAGCTFHLLFPSVSPQ